MSKLEKPVELPSYDMVPRWLVITQEIDLRLYILGQMQKDDLKKAPITRMVDEATGFDKALQKDAEIIMAELRWLRKEYDKETV